MSTINELAAKERRAGLRRTAERRAAGSVAATVPAIELRLARPGDDAAVRRLAHLDEAPELHGAVLLGLVDGRPAAALSLDDGRVVADPFILTNQVIALMRLRAQPRSDAPAWRRLRLRRRLRFSTFAA